MFGSTDSGMTVARPSQIYLADIRGAHNLFADVATILIDAFWFSAVR